MDVVVYSAELVRMNAKKKKSWNVMSIQGLYDRVCLDSHVTCFKKKNQYDFVPAQEFH